MHRVIAIALAGFGLSGCASYSLDAFSPAPAPVQVQLESVPSGADARTSVGPSCITPCSVAVPVAGNFTVTYTLNKFQPTTVPVQVVTTPGGFLTAATTAIDPNPVVAELKPAGPPPRAARKMMRPKKRVVPKPAATAQPTAGSPFPPPAAPTR
jgi:hypothetical protein